MVFKADRRKRMQASQATQEAAKALQNVSVNTFDLIWAISGIVLILLTILISRATGKGWKGILIDERGRYSLNRLQLVMWTLLVLSTFLGMFFTSVISSDSKALAANIDIAFSIPPTLLVLMGISIGSATAAGAVKNSKDMDPNVNVPKAGMVEPSPAARAQAIASGAPTPNAVPLPAKLSQVFLAEEGSQMDKVIDVSKFQNFWFTIALGFTYIVLVAMLPKPSYPVFSPTALWLLGVSHAGYVAGKMPTKV
jgi:hypothetical protein